MPETLAQETPTQAMRCMEIWGGNRAVDSAVSVPGIDAWVFSQPYAGDAGRTTPSSIS